jgi:arylsulfatase A-like enzyme
MFIAHIARTKPIVGLGLGLAVGLFVFAGCGETPNVERPPNVLLLVIDTLRADRVGVYGNDQPTSPRIDAFARDAIVFESALAPSPHTAPSHASLFTSTYPATHGVWNEFFNAEGERFYPTLSLNATTLADVLRDGGWQTAAIADGGYVSAGRGLAQGFSHFDSWGHGVEDRFAKAISWIGERDASRPFFLFLHTYEVHAPYVPPKGYENRFDADYQGPVRDALEGSREWLETGEIKDPLSDLHRRFFAPLLEDLDPADRDFLLALYDAELNLVDEQFGALLDYLSASNLLEDTLIVITADHGEEFGEHGKFTHEQVYQELLQIPLIIRLPGGPHGVRRDDLIDLVDLMPTLLGALGVPVPSSAQGRAIDLMSQGTGELPDRLLVGEVNREAAERQVSVRGLDLTAIFPNRDLVTAFVFDNRIDPFQKSALVDDPRTAPFLVRARDAVRQHWQRAEQVREEHELVPRLWVADQLSEEERAQLRMLGYLE